MVTFDPHTGQGDCRDGRRVDEISPFGSVNRQRNEQEVDLAIVAVRNAVLVEGPSPATHREALMSLRREWPTLYHAVMRLIQVT